jgi:hypothetical protein
MSDCNQTLGKVPVSIEYEIHMTQVDGSEFSVEAMNMSQWNGMVLTCLLSFTARFSCRCWTSSQSAGRLHPVVLVLATTIAFQIGAEVMQILHLWFYRSDGQGLKTLDMLSEVLFMLSQSVQSTLLIAIAKGYTLLPCKANRMAIVKWVAFFSVIIHTALVSFSKLKDETESKYHENEGVVGWILMSVRFLLLFCFLLAGQVSRKEGGSRLHGFFQWFAPAGAVYFLAYPLLFLLVQLFAPYLQHPVMHNGLLLMQIVSSMWLSELFLSQSTYFKVSSLSSPLLPQSYCTTLFDKLS